MIHLVQPGSVTMAGCMTALLSVLQVEAHDTRDSAWFIHDGRVYDGTKFLKEHPGGAESILMVAGQDATEEFNAIHSSKAKAMLADYLIGMVGSKAAAEEGAAPERAPIDKQVPPPNMLLCQRAGSTPSILLC